MSAAHVINLNGPWEVIALDEHGAELTQERINIRTPEDWTSIGQQQQSGEAQLLLKRQFNWPATDAPLIQLEIRGATPDQLTLNQQTLDYSMRNGLFLADIHRLQPSGNRLLICYGRANLVAGKSPISGVCLKICDSVVGTD